MSGPLPSRVFPSFNDAGDPCPVCGTRAPMPTVLVPIPGTDDGNLVQCKQVHRECYELVMRMGQKMDDKLATR